MVKRYMTQEEAVESVRDNPTWRVISPKIRLTLAAAGIVASEIDEYLTLAADQIAAVPRDEHEGVGAGVPSVVAIRGRAIHEWLDAHPSVKAALKQPAP